MDKLRQKFTRFMTGRYGVDDLSRFILGFAVVLMILNLFVRIRLVNTLVLLLLLLTYFRMFSRNFSARYTENAKYQELIRKVRWQKDHFLLMLRDRKTNHIYRCPKCGQKIRIPRGRGKIMVTCPKCREEFMRRS